jgi:hypothetical protein
LGTSVTASDILQILWINPRFTSRPTTSHKATWGFCMASVARRGTRSKSNVAAYK